MEKFQSLLKNFDLDSSKKLGKFSYGQRKKFLIAFALSTGCKLLLLDEPTNGLDIPFKSIFRKMVAANLRTDQTLVISIHQVKDVENLVDRLILVDQGRIVLDQLFSLESSFPIDLASLSLQITGYQIL